MNAPFANPGGASHASMVRHRPRGWETVLNPRVDYFFVFACQLILLLNNRLGSLAPLALIVLVGVQFLRLALRRDLRFFRASLILVIPIVCLLSAMWSAEPEVTLRYGILFSLTVLTGVLAASVHSHTGLLKALASALIIYNALAFISGDTVTWMKVGQTAFSGLAASKNAAANAAGFGMLSCLAWMYLEYKQGRPLFVGALFIPLSACGYILIAAHSTGALIAAVMACSGLVVWCVLRGIIQRHALLAFLLIAVLATAGVVLQYFLLDEALGYLLKESGKGAGMSGRADLWRVADAAIALNPGLGVGYGAFWLPTNIHAVGAWMESGIPIGAAFNFHNTPREILVSLGYVGLSVYIFVIAISFALAFLHAIRDPKITSLFIVAMMLYFFSRIYFEVIGFGQINPETMLFYTALSYPFFSYQNVVVRSRASRRRRWMRFGYTEPKVPFRPDRNR